MKVEKVAAIFGGVNVPRVLFNIAEAGGRTDQFLFHEFESRHHYYRYRVYYINGSEPDLGLLVKGIFALQQYPAECHQEALIILDIEHLVLPREANRQVAFDELAAQYPGRIYSSLGQGIAALVQRLRDDAA
jgi:hypothetical protein